MPSITNMLSQKANDFSAFIQNTKNEAIKKFLHITNRNQQQQKIAATAEPAIPRLPEQQQRSAINFYLGGGLKPEEIAEKLGVNKSLVDQAIADHAISLAHRLNPGKATFGDFMMASVGMVLVHGMSRATIKGSTD